MNSFLVALSLTAIGCGFWVAALVPIPIYQSKPVPRSVLILYGIGAFFWCLAVIILLASSGAT